MARYLSLRSSLLRCHRAFSSRRFYSTQKHPSLISARDSESFLRVRTCVVDCCLVNADGRGGSVATTDFTISNNGRGTLLAHPSELSPLKLRRRAHLIWEEGTPRSVLLVKKHHSEEAAAKLWEVAEWLLSQGLKVMVEEKVQKREFPTLEPFSRDDCKQVDLCVSLGGDGTFLHMASLFYNDQPLPPSVSFAMGTLGFLTPFDVEDYKTTLTRVLGASAMDPVFCTLRTRKSCKVFGPDGHLISSHHVLNECLVDRGSCPSMIKLEVFVDNEHVTTVGADGLIIATPSGSTAYSLSVGGPVVAPSVPCSLVTPIAPHSLSFRPLVVPESSDLVIHLPKSARSPARASFDGRYAMNLEPGSSIQCQTSECPMPVVNLGRLDHDWYEAITQKLKWNDPLIEARTTSATMPVLIDKSMDEI